MKRAPKVSILDAVDDPHLFGKAFRDPASWAAWRAFLASLFGLPMTPDQLATYRACTGRDTPPEGGSNEAWLVCGRRAGKSFTLAVIAVYLATFIDWRPFLISGERGTVVVVAADRKQARVILRYVRGLLHASAILKGTIKAERTEAIDLANSISIEIHTASFRTTRGYTIVAALLDEIAFWLSGDEAASSDVEIVSALKPAMSTIPGAMLLAASSPYARKGALWEAYRRHYGQDGRVVVWQAPTRQMNPTVKQSVIDDALAEDPARYGAEYLANFRTDVEAFVAREVIEACITEPGIFERPPAPGVRYSAFCDPSGGSSDSMTLAIGHNDKGIATLDCIREVRPPFSPEAVVIEFAATLKTYGLAKVSGDKYGGLWPSERFSENGITYIPADKPKSEIYRDLLPILNSGRASLLDSKKLVAQLVGLERRTTRSGRDLVDHSPGSHDDLGNAVAGVLVQLIAKPKVGYSGEQMIAAVLGKERRKPGPIIWTNADRLKMALRR